MTTKSRYCITTNPATPYKSDGEKFTELMREEWAHVEYNDTTRQGEVRAGTLGDVKFYESNNDPAVIVYIPKLRIKGSPETVAKAMEEIAAVINNYSD